MATQLLPITVDGAIGNTEFHLPGSASMLSDTPSGDADDMILSTLGQVIGAILVFDGVSRWIPSTNALAPAYINFGSTLGTKLMLYNPNYGIGIQGSEMQFFVNGAARFAWNTTGTLQPANTNWGMYLSAGNLTLTGFLDVGAGITAGDSLNVITTDAVTNTISTVAWLTHNSTGTPVAGFGTNFEFRAETAGTGGGINNLIGRMYFQWSDPNHATRDSYFTLAGYRNAVFFAMMQCFASGGVGFNGAVDPGANYVNVPTGGGYKVNNVDILANRAKTGSALIQTGQYGTLSSTAAVANPGTMAGCGTSASITPTTSGNIIATFSGYMRNTSTGQSAAMMRWGTGTAPANGVAATGTAVGGVANRGALGANLDTPFSLTGAINGVAGTTYWFDMNLWTNGTGTTSIIGVSFTAMEIP
jgi:hypothetical protein